MKNSSIEQKRKVLLNMTQQARDLRAKKVKEAEEQGKTNEALFWASRTINSIIIEYFYKKNGNTRFETFNKWKNEGMSVIKGEKAYVIWGRPLGAQYEEKGEEPDKDTEKYFPISHIFSNKQVKKQ